MDIGELLKKRNIELEFLEHKRDNFKDFTGKAVITNEDLFTKNLLLKSGINKFHTVSEASIKRAKEIKKLIREEEIVGFGGGKALDIAKKVSFDLNKELITVPTAPSHDGLISINCSLHDGKKRKTIPTKYSRKIIIPVYLWKNSGNLKKAGICDLFSNLVALQDLSLAEKSGEKFSEFYKKLSFGAVKKILGSVSDRTLAEALIISGLAMEETSRYCSGSEHEAERLLENKINGGKYLHGQLAGTGSLISAKVYSIHLDKLKNLKFNSKNFFEYVKSLMKKKNVFEFALQPLKDEKFRPEMLRELGKVRPERYTLWNFIDSKKVDWDKITAEILER